MNDFLSGFFIGTAFGMLIAVLLATILISRELKELGKKLKEVAK